MVPDLNADVRTGRSIAREIQVDVRRRNSAFRIGVGRIADIACIEKSAAGSLTERVAEDYVGSSRMAECPIVSHADARALHPKAMALMTIIENSASANGVVAGPCGSDREIPVEFADLGSIFGQEVRAVDLKRDVVLGQ